MKDTLINAIKIAIVIHDMAVNAGYYPNAGVRKNLVEAIEIIQRES